MSDSVTELAGVLGEAARKTAAQVPGEFEALLRAARKICNVADVQIQLEILTPRGERIGTVRMLRAQ